MEAFAGIVKLDITPVFPTLYCGYCQMIDLDCDGVLASKKFWQSHVNCLLTYACLHFSQRIKEEAQADVYSTFVHFKEKFYISHAK